MFSLLVSREITATVNTWRIWVIGGVLVFSALAAPAVAAFTPQILHALAGSEFEALAATEPGPRDAYGQWVKNLVQMVLPVLIVTQASAVAGPVGNGTMHFLAVQPVTRGQIVAAGAVADTATVAATTVLATGVVWAGTGLAFSRAPAACLVWATLVWLAGALFFTAVARLASALCPSTGAAAGIGLVVFLVSAAAGFIDGAVRFTPVGCLSYPAGIAAGTASVGDAACAVAAALAGTVLATAAAMAAFSRRQL
ncbi:ABC transporter permease subunit [Corynebacterium mendelii]|uniref:ABC transporter permease subunit n=1 Tax=Corynebacterium mendelii TaxID=2765362 RepID=A0A939IWP4_9CORY|nr:ABC transporter permease subunit [Corynebacterium mendelii]MBN9643640.1 ABC transporter permease subunit [Corynebacterium mendelii]